jgi:hypothetical protein
LELNSTRQSSLGVDYAAACRFAPVNVQQMQASAADTWHVRVVTQALHEQTLQLKPSNNPVAASAVAQVAMASARSTSSMHRLLAPAHTIMVCSQCFERILIQSYNTVPETQNTASNPTQST